MITRDEAKKFAESIYKPKSTYNEKMIWKDRFIDKIYDEFENEKKSNIDGAIINKEDLMAINTRFISKELLSAILDKKALVTDVVDGDLVLHYFVDGVPIYDKKNIYELVHKDLKKWAKKEGISFGINWEKNVYEIIDRTEKIFTEMMKQQQYDEQQKIKYIVAPTLNACDYWAKELDLDSKKIKYVVTVEDARGINFTNENTLILLGEKYDYPEASYGFRGVAVSRFYEALDTVKRRIEINKRSE